LTVLRMPRFSLGEEEAQSLVNYFAATDKRINPALGLTYPYVALPQRENDYLNQASEEYVKRLKGERGAYNSRVERLKPVWDLMLKDQKALEDARLADAEARVKQARKEADQKKQDPEKKKKLEEAEADLTRIKKEVQDRKKELDDKAKKGGFQKDWEGQ